MAAGDFTLLFLNEALRIPGERILSEQPRTRLNLPDAGHNEAGTLWQYGSTYRLKFTWQLQAIMLTYERDWIEWLLEVWSDNRHAPLEVWDETQILPDLTPPKRAIAPGTTGQSISANKTHLYPRCEATLMPGTQPSVSWRGNWRGLECWDLSLQLLEGSMFPYSGNMSPAIPIDVTPVTNASSSSGQTPGGGTGINAPPSLALGSTAGLITAGDNASGPVNLTNLVVTDDGIGINNLVSGSSLAEVAGTTLRIRQGVTLTPGVVNLPVYVIDYSLPNQPQGSAAYQLTVLQYDLTITTASLSERTTTAPIVLATIVTSGYTGTSFSLSGTDAAIFELSGAQLRLRSGTVLDFEAATTKTVDVNLTSNQGSKTRSYSLAITNVNEAPVVASLTATADTAVALNTVLATATANDPEEGNPATGGTWSITGVTGGSNALNRFAINAGGQITNTVTPMNAGTDVLTVSYTDAGGLSNSNTAAITFGGTVVNGVTFDGEQVTFDGVPVTFTP